MSYMNGFGLNNAAGQHQHEIRWAVSQKLMSSAHCQASIENDDESLLKWKHIKVTSLRHCLKSRLRRLRRRIGLGMISLGKQLAQVQRAS